MSIIWRRLENKQDEGGFTLIELLVVVIIIGILAAIAIPVFLNQRERAWHSAVQSDLRNAAIGQETYFTDHSAYTDVEADLEDAGFNSSASITIEDLEVDGNTYCMVMSHEADDNLTAWEFRSEEGQPVHQNPDGTNASAPEDCS